MTICVYKVLFLSQVHSILTRCYSAIFDTSKDQHSILEQFSAASRTTNTTAMHSVAVRVAAASSVTRTALPAISATSTKGGFNDDATRQIPNTYQTANLAILRVFLLKNPLWFLIFHCSPPSSCRGHACARLHSLPKGVHKEPVGEERGHQGK